MKKILSILFLLPSLCLATESGSPRDNFTSYIGKHQYRVTVPHGWMLKAPKTLYA